MLGRQVKKSVLSGNDLLFELLPDRSSKIRTETLTITFCNVEVTGDLFKSNLSEMVEMEALLEGL